MKTHDCEKKQSGWSDVQILFDPEEGSWDLVVEFNNFTKIKYCPYCGCELKSLE